VVELVAVLLDGNPPMWEVLRDLGRPRSHPASAEPTGHSDGQRLTVTAR